MAGAPPTDHALAARLAIGGAAMLALAVLCAGVLAFASAGDPLRLSLAVACAAVGVGALVSAWQGLRARAAAIERLRAEMVTVTPPGFAPPPAWRDPARRTGPLAPLVGAAMHLTERMARSAQRPDARLAAVLATIDEGMIAVTSTGLISLINGPAATLLGAEHGIVGTSVFASIERHDLELAIGAAIAGGRPMRVGLDLADGTEIQARITALPADQGGGAVIAFAARDLSRHGEIAHDLSLHRAPALLRTGFTEATPLTELPAVVLDTETTGLDVASARVVAIGAVRMHGSAPLSELTVDRLVNPGVPIPLVATGVHGITSAMVADAEPFAAIWSRDVVPFVAGCVWVGHNIGYDLSLLRRECERASLPWQPPVCLDTGLLHAGLDPLVDDGNLDALADRLSIDPRGRHTALGDALVTAEVMMKLIAWLTADGCRTLAEARAVMGRAGSLVRTHARAGWDPILR